jgi:hypothetical protein
MVEIEFVDGEDGEMGSGRGSNVEHVESKQAVVRSGTLQA